MQIIHEEPDLTTPFKIRTDPERVSDTAGRDDTDKLIRELQGWVITLSITLTVVTALLIWVRK